MGLLAKWIGASTSKSEGRRFYSGFSKNGQQIRLNDCIYVKSDDKGKVWLMKVLRLWEEEDWSPSDDAEENMFFKGVWLYRPADTPHGSNVAQHPREVFISDWEDENPIECVKSKCPIAFRLSQPDQSDELDGAHFVCWRSFEVSTSHVTPCESHEDAPVDAKTENRKRKASKVSQNVAETGAEVQSSPSSSNLCSPRSAKIMAVVKLADFIDQKSRGADLFDQKSKGSVSGYGSDASPKGTGHAASKGYSSPALSSSPSSECRRSDSNKEMGVATWIGNCTSVSGGRRFYGGFSKNGQQFRLNDCVYVKSAERDKVWLMKILKVWEEEKWTSRDADDDNMFFKGVWLYRPSDTPQGPTVALHPREVFISDWEDDNPIECVQTKCHVSFRSSPPQDEQEMHGAHLVCWRSFTVSTSQVAPCRPHGEVSGHDESTKGIKEGLKQELAMGLVTTVRLGARDGASARLLLREAGHMLADAMIHMPVSHIARILLSPSTETMVLMQGEAMLGAATYRKHVDKGLMEIELLAVKGSLQRRGYGAVLVDGLKGIGSSGGMGALVTCADDTAVGFFEACGFEIVVRAPGSKVKLSSYDNSILMRLPLPLRTDMPLLSPSLI